MKILHPKGDAPLLGLNLFVQSQSILKVSKIHPKHHVAIFYPWQI
jgi:hypothetical protein